MAQIRTRQEPYGGGWTSQTGRASLPILLVWLALARASAAPFVDLGNSDPLPLDQPRVAVELFEPPGEESSQSLGPDIFNSFLLDTGANGIMAAGIATTELEEAGYQIDCYYDEAGVAGTEEFGLSALYHFDFAGTSGVRNRLEFSRILSSTDANFGSFGGIVGMPAMMNRITSLDFTVWSGGAIDFMRTEFPTELPASSGHRYSVPLQLVHFERTGQRDPADPLPTWAPLPFAGARLEHAGHSSSGQYLCDTGAQMSIISTTTALAVGLDTNGNGTVADEAQMWLPIGGIGGMIDAPVFEIERFVIPTDQGVDLIWNNIAVIVLDIAGIPGIFGSDILTAGWSDAVLGSGADGAVNYVHFDFRDAANDNGSMLLDLNPARDIVMPEDAPRTTVSSPRGFCTNLTPIPFTVAFSQDVIGFELSDVGVTGGTVDTFQAVAGTHEYELIVTPNAPGVQVVVEVPAFCCANANGSGNTPGIFPVVYDPDAVTTTVTSPAASPTDTEPIPFTIGFSDAVSGFSEDFLVITNGRVTQFAAVVGTNSYTVEVTPFIDGTVTLQVPAAIADGFVFMSTYTQAQHSVVFDQTSPGVTVVCDVSSPTSADPIPFTITFDETVTGFDASDVQVTNGTVSQLQETLAGREYALQVAPTAPGEVTVTVLENAATDAAGNTNAAAASTVTAVSANQAPVAQNATFNVVEDDTWSGTLTATDTDAGDTLTYRIVTAPAHGSLTDFTAATGSFVYEPAPNFNGPDTFTFDATDGTVASNTGTVAITVTSVNDAPVLTPVNPALLPGITEDETDNSGVAVGTLLTGSVTDVDNGALQGVAVFNCTGTAGTWQYRLDAAPNWLDLSAPGPTQAMLLRGEDRIRFRPDGTLGTVAGLEFCAWDQSAGAAANTADVSARGGSTAFSTALDTVTLLVADVNDLPELGGGAISPDPAYLGDTLTAVPGAWSDADGDSPGYFYQWAIDGTDVPGAENATIAGSQLRQGDSVTCRITPWDGTDTGTPVQTPPVVIGWLFSIQVRDSGGTAVQFGMEPGAGPGFDPGIDVEATVGGRFDGDIYFVQAAQYYSRDMRSVSDTADWLLTVVAGTADAVLEWDALAVPPDRYLSLLSAAADGTPSGDLSVNMGLESELAVAAGETRHFLIRYAADVSVALAFTTGYNLMSLPVEPLDPAVDSVLAAETGARDGTPVHTGPVWVWNDTHYTMTGTMHAQTGVWIYVETPCVVTVHGLPVDPILNLVAGWNLIGPTTQTPVPRDNRLNPTFWTWDTTSGQRVAANPGDILQPGRGYWVLAYGACQITPSR